MGFLFSLLLLLFFLVSPWMGRREDLGLGTVYFVCCDLFYHQKKGKKAIVYVCFRRHAKPWIIL